MDIASWVINVLLALAFVMAGGMKLSKTPAELKANGMEWVEDFPDGAPKVIGGLQILGAIGLILPKALDIAPVLSPIAAVALTVMMLGAVIVHLRRHENPGAAAVLAVLSAAAAVLGFATL